MIEPCRTKAYQTVPKRTEPNRTVPNRAEAYRAEPYRTVPNRVEVYRAEPYQTVQYSTVQSHTLSVLRVAVPGIDILHVNYGRQRG